MRVKVNLAKAQDVKDFVAAASNAPFEVTAGEGKYIVDGKSIMGVFSLNLAAPITVSVDKAVEESKPEAVAAFKEKLSAWIVE